MTPLEAALTVSVGLLAGVLSGLFGVGGGVVMTPGLTTLTSLPAIVAVATPLPVILPTALMGAFTYHRAGEVDLRAARWIAIPGAVAAVLGAALTQVVDAQLLLFLTAVLLAWQSVDILRGGSKRTRDVTSAIPIGTLVLVGVIAGSLSGLLGIGGGIIIVPALAGMLHMPLKRALGTSLTAVVVLAIPGTIVHAALGNIDWTTAVLLALGSIPGARIGAKIALGTRERSLRILVGSFLGLIAVVYGVQQIIELTRSG